MALAPATSGRKSGRIRPIVIQILVARYGDGENSSAFPTPPAMVLVRKWRQESRPTLLSKQPR